MKKPANNNPQSNTSDIPGAKKAQGTNVWMISTAILFVLFAYLLISYPRPTEGATVLSEDEIKSLSETFVKDNLVPPGVSVSIKNVSLQSDVYRIVISLQSGAQKQDVTSYVTKDGKLFLMQGVDIDKVNSATKPSEETETNTNTVTTSEKPDVELFVMSFCPYGVQAENAMKPVFDLLGDKINLKVRFIANAAGDTPGTVDSLHGAPEAEEDLRQICVMKNYNSATYWKYVSEINAKCASPSIYRDATKMDACWKSAAATAGVDSAKIFACSNSTESVALIKADEALVGQYGVRGSPTIIINGNTYSGARTAEAFKEAICNAFTTKPQECSAAVNATVQADTEQHSCG